MLLISVAEAGLVQPLPEGWRPCKTLDTKEVYFFDFKTGRSMWEHPCGTFFKTPLLNSFFPWHANSQRPGFFLDLAYQKLYARILMRFQARQPTSTCPLTKCPEVDYPLLTGTNGFVRYAKWLAGTDAEKCSSGGRVFDCQCPSCIQVYSDCDLLFIAKSALSEPTCWPDKAEASKRKCPTISCDSWVETPFEEAHRKWYVRMKEKKRKAEGLERETVPPPQARGVIQAKEKCDQRQIQCLRGASMSCREEIEFEAAAEERTRRLNSASPRSLNTSVRVADCCVAKPNLLYNVPEEKCSVQGPRLSSQKWERIALVTISVLFILSIGRRFYFGF